MNQQDQHFDVAAYALGVLDEDDAVRFEEHLIDCASCAAELESFLPVADVLADVDADALVSVEESRKDGMLLSKLVLIVGNERHRANSRRLYSLAAAVVIFAMLSVGALFAGANWLAPEQQQPPVAQKTPTPLAPAAPGIGDPSLDGKRISRTDARTGVRLDADLKAQPWGTQLQVVVSNITGPKQCRLVAVREDGGTEVLSTWTVGAKGWGTAEQPDPLILPDSTALTRDKIAYLQIQEVRPDGSTQTLVTAP